MTGRPVLIVFTVLSITLPLAIIVLWSRAVHRAHYRSGAPAPTPAAGVPTPAQGRSPLSKLVAKRRTTRGNGWFIAGTAGRMLTVLASHLVVIMLAIIAINNQPGYAFFSNWTDFYGQVKTFVNPNAKVDQVTEPITDPTQLEPGKGSVQVHTIDGKQVLYWLPPGYDNPAAHTTKYPVLMFLPGQPSGPATVYKQYAFGTVASQAIDEGKIAPFIGVFPPIMVAPPKDTECTDIPGGPQAETWLTATVPAETAKLYRTAPTGKNWSVAGWSTGGFCATKLALKHPQQFSSATSIGGYLKPWGKNNEALHTLFKGDANLEKANTPMEIYRSLGTRGASLLFVSGVEDKSSYPQIKQLSNISRGDPTIRIINFDKGGHNFTHYRGYLLAILEWTGARFRQ